MIRLLPDTKANTIPIKFSGYVNSHNHLISSRPQSYTAGGHPIAGMFFIIFFILFAGSVNGQQLKGVALLDSLLAAENYVTADSALESQITTLQKATNVDSLAHYPYYVGRITEYKTNEAQAAEAAETFVRELQGMNASARGLRKAHLELAGFYASIGRIDEAYKTTEQARSFTQKLKDNPELLGEVENNLGVLARRKGNIALATKHHRTALDHFTSDENTAPENYYISYNNMGAMMWFSSKTDSAIYYYDRALHTLAEMKPVPKNRYYRPANVMNNKAALFSISGRTTRAVETMREVVKKYQQFIDSSEVPDADRNNARESLFRSIENLGSVYKELGYFSKTRELLMYSYTQKKRYLGTESPELFKAQILLGQIELSLKNYTRALEYLNAGIEHMERMPGEYLIWSADAHYSKALVYDELNETETAAIHFEQAGALFKMAYGDSYDAFYLDFLTNSALFYAENGDAGRARSLAQESLDYVIQNDGENTLLAFKHRLNLAQTYYESGSYQDAKYQAGQSIAILKDDAFRRSNLMDSVQIRYKLPDALLLEAKADYHLKGKRDTAFLADLLQRLDEALAILDQNKWLLTNDEDVSVQIANNKQLFDFAKKIALELYQQTGNKKYLDRTISYHESAIYNRIRTRLNRHKTIRFADVADSVRNREIELKEQAGDALETNDINGYLQTSEDWNLFIKTLQSDHPRYFTLRYGNAEKHVVRDIPEGSTVIRYFFTEGKLYALLIDESATKLFPLHFKSVAEHISVLQQETEDVASTAGLLHDLYTTLWQPFENQIATNRVIIIPDGELFNLSFETLVSEPVTSYPQLVQKSLLQEYAMSYNYTLSLLKERAEDDYEDNFIAFAPGFTEELKQTYRKTVHDSLFFDQPYLNLLPQPFTVDLVHKLNRSFRGEIFTGEESTKQQFTSSAVGHQIIHIGTHAESNNLRPELSRLLFAKETTTDETEGDNSLYAYEIYNYDFSSHLTLLTACGTGKPRYQPGEGMISLAHAFNYAGSKSLLTALWNIDEKASSEIVDLFYQNLANGLSKDMALQQAKLSYLSRAEGRTAAPQFWAGLVVLGDASAVPIERAGLPWSWILAGVLLLAVPGMYFLVERK